MGYRGQVPASAARSIDGGWWTVGDRGMIDDAGNLYVGGRGSSLIITGGANVQPEEVEHVLKQCPGVAACVVVGLPDPKWGELVCAAVVPETPRDLRRADLRAHAAAALAPIKRPRRYVALGGPVPLGRSGKVDRQRVRELVMQAGPEREIR
jgi:acyl-CoA synthetase (AMP-forming)/AMP-acid ligase II